MAMVKQETMREGKRAFCRTKCCNHPPGRKVCSVNLIQVSGDGEAGNEHQIEEQSALPFTLHLS